jgi:hypothetical protein
MIATLAALAMAAAPAGDAAHKLVALQGMYEQSCQVKAYGSYDDLCNVLKKQMKEAEREQRKQRQAAKAQPAPEPAKPAEAVAVQDAAKPGS